MHTQNIHLCLHRTTKYQCTVYSQNFAPVLFSPFSPSECGQIQNWANWNICKGLCEKIWEWANSRLGKSVLDLYRAKIRLGEFKAVYSIPSATRALIISIIYLPKHGFEDFGNLHSLLWGPKAQDVYYCIFICPYRGKMHQVASQL